MIGNLFV